MRHASIRIAPRRRQATPLRLTLLALLVAASPALGQVWTPTGPVDGRISGLDGHPTTAGRLLAAADGTLYLSEDEGATWTPVLSESIQDVVVSPADPDVAYALADRRFVYRSQDGGLTWQVSLDLLTSDHLLGNLWADPVDPEVAYFSERFSILFSEDPTTLRRTEDGGETWGLGFFGIERDVIDVAFGSGLAPVRLATTFPHFLLRSEDDGESWTQLEPDLPGSAITTMAGDPTTAGRFLGTTFDGGLLESTDSGDSWHPYGVGLPGGAFPSLLFDPTNPTTVYAMTLGQGVYRSVDSGATWAPVGTGSPSDRLEGPRILALTGDPLRLFAASDGGVQVADPSRIPPCVVGPATLCLEGGRFEARIAWEDFQGGAGEGRAVPLTADTGAFWFFRDTNLEVAVKVLDGTPVNGFFWNFYGSLSNVPFTLTVRDSATGDQRFYVNPPRTFASRGDTRGFPERSPGTGGGLIAPGELIELGGDFGTAAGAATGFDSNGFGWNGLDSIGLGGGTGACVPSATALCLQDGRFRVEVEWQDFQGGTGDGRTVPLTGDSGAFWFFDDANLELLVKVLDARPVNDRFWVFYGSLSNVAFTLTVTDTETGEPRVYENPARTFASRGDTAAF